MSVPTYYCKKIISGEENRKIVRSMFFPYKKSLKAVETYKRLCFCALSKNK